MSLILTFFFVFILSPFRKVNHRTILAIVYRKLFIVLLFPAGNKLRFLWSYYLLNFHQGQEGNFRLKIRVSVLRSSRRRSKAMATERATAKDENLRNPWLKSS